MMYVIIWNVGLLPKGKQLQKKERLQELTNFIQLACDIELISYVTFMLDQGNILDMNTLHEKCRKSLVEFEICKKDLLRTSNRYIKELPLAEFVKAPKYNMPECTLHRKTNKEKVDMKMQENTFEDLQGVLKVAKMVRNEILSMEELTFQLI